jgi:hypothetical protein
MSSKEEEREMKNLWSVLCITVVAAAVAAPTQVQAQGFDICDILPFLPGCDDDDGECDCTEEIEDLQGQIDALAGQTATTNAALAEAQAAIVQLETDVDDLEEQIQNVVDNGFDCADFENREECDGHCVNTNNNEANCGACGNECDANEECHDGACEPKVCEAPAGDPNFECNEAILNADGTCTYVPRNANGACDDENACTSASTCNNGTCLGNGNTPCAVGETCVITNNAEGHVCLD